MSGTVHPLRDNQALAVDPGDSVWLSASAGTGKTQVLSARVLRLLLRRDVDPSQILCLTFTKAGAAEMANRVNEVLANWVRMKPEVLARDLRAIGASVNDETQDRARSLFASVLDCPGGGLRIDTIHAFAQWLLAAFPEEAGLSPGSRAMEDRDRELLAHQLLADMLVEWEKSEDAELLDALAMLSLRMGADGARSWLMRCADARDVWFGDGAWQDDVEPRVRQLLGLAADAGPDDLAALLSDSIFAVGDMRQCIEILNSWGTPTARKIVLSIEQWLEFCPQERTQNIEVLAGSLFNKGDFDTTERKPGQLRHIIKRFPEYEAYAGNISDSLTKFFETQKLLLMVEWLAPALRIGRRFALRWEDAKAREGLIDFDDQIRRAAKLLSRSDISDWIRYKLDRQFDHILIDEAQDTNEAQWSIIKALTEEYFAGKGQRDEKLRTIFVVGDYKQAIFRFQGTSPENFETARLHFRKIMREAAENAAVGRERVIGRDLQDLGLDQSFRTAQPVLDFVDKAIGAIGHDAFGLKKAPDPHVGENRPGEVVLWDPVSAFATDDDAPDGEESWISEPERRMADRIAKQVSDWLREGYPLAKGTSRNAGPGDIMVLVRKRKELAGLIVARLHAAGVPVAGVDRLRLGAPLAVKDLMAAMRFAAQPLDDLSLANLLVSPLLGWSQQDLLDHGYRDKHVYLWDHLRKSDAPLPSKTSQRLRDLLRLADYEPPQALLHWMLVGPWQGRKSLVARLGQEANDPIDELLNAALNYASAHTPSLQGFIQWFDAGDGELKREAGASEGLVRVMTVHGSKGLQAPIVILADATGDPDKSAAHGVTLTEPTSGKQVPVPYIRAAEMVPAVEAAKEAIKHEERQEHWRLLYVAMTRAEEALFVGGALGRREEAPASDSWYARLSLLLPDGAEDDRHFGKRRVWGARPPSIGAVQAEPANIALPVLPEWATTPVGPEPKPPRPLAPSSAGDEKAADPPLPPEVAKIAARRGVLIHSLLERLSDIAPEKRQSAASAWLERRASDLSSDEREEILTASLTVLDTAEFSAIFGPDALAEVPLAATVDGQVVAGIADRLLVNDDAVTVVDFKTAKRPPLSLEQVPQGTLKQMAAYVAALEVIYPDRRISAALLYTQTPQLIALPAEILEAHKSRLSTEQQSFPPSPVE